MAAPESQDSVPYRLKSGEPLALGPVMASGGEGRIYSLPNDPSRVAKLYFKTTLEKARKLEAMLDAAPDDPSRTRRHHVSICWPESLVVDDSGAVAGFLMPRLEPATHHKLALMWDPEDRAAAAPGFTWKHLCVAAMNICSMVELIHAKGHVIGDLNEENLLIDHSALATIVDCDSMQVRDPASGALFRSPVAREPYVAPEMIGKVLIDHDRAVEEDYWALAVLIFEILMEGQHPTNGIGYPEEREERIRHGLFPFLNEPGFALPRYAVSFDVLPEALRALFTRCFRDGHARPSVRPTAFDWRCELQLLSGSLHQCPVGELHWHPAHLLACPWCEQKRLFGIDRFRQHSSVIVEPRASSHAPQSETSPPAAESSWSEAEDLEREPPLEEGSSESTPEPGPEQKTRPDQNRGPAAERVGKAEPEQTRDREREQDRQKDRQGQNEKEKPRRSIWKRVAMVAAAVVALAGIGGVVMQQQAEERRRAEESEIDRQGETVRSGGSPAQLNDYLRNRAAHLSPNVFRVVLQNTCADAIYVATRLKLPDQSGAWVTYGWYEVSPGQTTHTNLVTNNRYFYFYAETKDRKRTWDGRAEAAPVRAQVVNTLFAHVDGQPIVGANARRVTMFPRHFEQFGDQTVTVSCP